MIAFRDFAPKEPDALNLGSFGDFGPLEAALQAANDWVARERVDVINVETVVLPSYSHRVSKTETTQSAVYVNLGNYWFACRQFIRVWYQA